MAGRRDADRAQDQDANESFGRVEQGLREQDVSHDAAPLHGDEAEPSIQSREAAEAAHEVRHHRSPKAVSATAAISASSPGRSGRSRIRFSSSTATGSLSTRRSGRSDGLGERLRELALVELV